MSDESRLAWRSLCAGGKLRDGRVAPCSRG